MSEKPMLKISFVISTWNSKGEIEKCLDSLETLEGEREVIVIDQSSLDGTRQILETRKDITPIFLDRKLSWCRANEIGIAKTKGDWIIVANPDIYFNKHFNKLLEWLRLQTYPYPIVGCNLVDPDGTFQKAAGVADFRRMFIYSSSLGRLIGRFLLPNTTRQFGIPEAKEIARVQHLNASLFIIHRETVNSLGKLWGDAYLWPAADSDMFERAIRKQVPILIYPISLVHHKWHSRKNTSLPDFDAIFSYSYIVYCRYWNMHPRLMFLFYMANAILFPLMRFLRGKDSLANGIRRASGQVKGVLIGYRVRL